MPNRIIKESICSSETLAQLSAAQERHFWRIVVTADDYGRFDARPASVRARCYVALLDRVSEKESEAHTQALGAAGLVRLYEVEGRRYGQIVTWANHQHRRAKVSKFPPPPNGPDGGKPTRMHMHADASRREQPLAHALEESRNRGIEESRNRGIEERDVRASPDRGPPAAAGVDDAVAELSQVYEREIGQITPLVADRIKAICEELRPPVEWCRDAVAEAVKYNARRLAYVEQVLRRWSTEGRGPKPNGQGREAMRQPNTEDLAEQRLRESAGRLWPPGQREAVVAALERNKEELSRGATGTAKRVIERATVEDRDGGVGIRCWSRPTREWLERLVAAEVGNDA